MIAAPGGSARLADPGRLAGAGGNWRLAGLPLITSALDPHLVIPPNAPHFLLAETVPSTTPGWNAKIFTSGFLYTVSERRLPFGAVTYVDGEQFLNNGATEVLLPSPNRDVLVWSADYDRQLPPGAPDLYRGVHLYSVATGMEFADLGADIERYPPKQSECSQDTLVTEMKDLMTLNGVSDAEIGASSWKAGFFSLPVAQTSWMLDIAWASPDELRVVERLEVVGDVPSGRFSLGFRPFDVRYRIVAGQRPQRLSCTILPVGGYMAGPTVVPGRSVVSGAPVFAFRGQTVLEERPRGQRGPSPLSGRPVGAFLYPDPPVP